MNRLKIFKVFIVIALAMVMAVTDVSAGSSDITLTLFSFDELNAMEVKANMARREYWIGNYEKALEIFNSINTENHASTSLYEREIGTCYLNLGDYQKAKDHFYTAVQYGEFFQNQELEKKALSNYGREEEKIYLGDPFEQTFAYMIMAMLFMDKGDYDNALAACKSGLMADSDTTENRYESDLTLLHLIEAKCHILRGDPETADQIRSRALESYKMTSDSVRDIYSERLSQIAVLKLSSADKKKMKINDSDEEINNKILALDQKLEQAISSIEVNEKLGSLLTGSYNTLVVVPTGKGPKKVRKGKSGNMVMLDINTATGQQTEVFLNGAKLDGMTPAFNVANVDFQASTRGGRRMDAILNGQAAFRDTTVHAGAMITDIGNNVGGIGGLAVALIGAAIQGAGAAVNAEADTRCWQTLPSDFAVYALDLPLGDHEVVFCQNVYFERKNEIKKKIRIESKNDMAVVFGPSSLMGMYPQQGFASTKPKKSKKKKANENAVVLITPPIGFDVIERFPALTKNNKPEAFAPDSRKMVRTISKILKKNKVGNIKTRHNDCISKKAELAAEAPLALQVQLVDLGCTKKENGDIEYRTTLSYSLVETQSGKKIFKSEVEGVALKTKKDKKLECTKIFYNCFKSASETFVQQPGFMETVQQAMISIEESVALN